MRKFLPVLVLTMVMSVLFNGCGDPSPEDVIGMTIESVENVGSYSIREETVQTYMGETLTYTCLIDFVLPDKMYESRDQGNSSRELVMIGQTEYTKTPDDDKWRIYQSPEISSPDNMIVSLVGSLDELKYVEQVDDEKIEGIDCFHYIGTEVAPNEYKPQVKIEFWIGKTDYLPRYFEISYGTENAQDEDVQDGLMNKIWFSNFNKPIQIETPAIDFSDGVDLITDVHNINTVEDNTIAYVFTISNQGLETAGNVKIYLETPATDDGLKVLEAKSSAGSVSLALGERESFIVSWEYNLTDSSKDEFTELNQQNKLKAVWFGEDGERYEKTLEVDW